MDDVYSLRSAGAYLQAQESRRQVRTTLLLAMIGPPVASLMGFVAGFWPLHWWRASPDAIGLLSLVFIVSTSLPNRVGSLPPMRRFLP